MATNTTNLNLIKPAGSERVQISQINQNMDILDEKIGAVGDTSVQSQITATNGLINSLKNQVTIAKSISGTTDAEFVANLASAVNQQITLSSLPVGTTLLGSAEWTGKTFCQFMMTKIGDNACNVHVANGASKEIIARFNINDFSVTSVVDILGQLTAMFPTNAAWVNNTDINTLTSTGLYPIGQGNTNAGGTWGIMLVLAPRSDSVEQIHLGYGGMSIREYRSSTGWTQWFAYARQ